MDLTVALSIAGGLVLAGLVGHSMWQTRRASPRRAEPQAPAPRVEPSLAPSGEPAAASEPPTEPELRIPSPAPRAGPRLDALIDAIAPLALEAPVSGEFVLAHLPPSRRAGGKPFHIEALNAVSGEWELPAPGQRYTELQAGVQLANRSGALNQIEYSEFVQKVEAFAEAVGARADLPDMLDVVARARELDAFASPSDAQLAVHLGANSVAWSVGYIQQCAARHGFVPGAVPGRVVLPAAEEGAPPMLVLSFDAQAALAEDPNAAALRQATLSLDVPQTPEAGAPFAAWQQAARALAEDMDATLFDDDGRAIGPESFAAIEQALGGLYRGLESRDLAAGTPAARRLFS